MAMLTTGSLAGARHVLLHLCDECNYHCVYCYRQSSADSMSFDEWADLLRQARTQGARDVSFLGGEPLLYGRLKELLALARQLRYSTIYLYTNGSLIDKEWRTVFKKYNVVLVVKFESRPEVYRSLTQQEGASLERVRQNIGDCVSSGLGVLTFIVLSKKNVGDVGRLIRDSLKLGAFPVLERFIPVVRTAAQAGLDITNDEFDAASGAMEKVFSPVKFLYVLTQVFTNKTSCGCYNNSISVTSSGSVLPCPFLAESQSVGNIREYAFKTLQQKYASKQQSVYGVGVRKLFDKKRPSSCCRTYSFNKTGAYPPVGVEFCDRMNRVGYMLVRMRPMKWLVSALIKRTELI